MDGQRYIGLMSGTSMDGVDGVILEMHRSRPRVTHSRHIGMPADLRQEFLALNERHGTDEIHRGALSANRLMQLYAEVVQSLLHHAHLDRTDIRALGVHGQTVRHMPGKQPAPVSLTSSWMAYTVQLTNPALLVELTGIPVVSEFRHRDVAASGQGAPLVPAFHAAMFAKPGRDVAVVNIGGMANATWLDHTGDVAGFDTGPGNVLLDGWCERHTGQAFDKDGAWSTQGHLHSALLERLLAEPYFSLQGARSTGRELFNLSWLDQHLTTLGCAVAPADVQATLVALTAKSIAASLPEAGNTKVVVCGGGALNPALMQSLRTALPTAEVTPSDDMGLPAMDVEAAAFAWLACQTLHGRTSNVPKATGALGPRVLGAIYPA